MATQQSRPRRKLNISLFTNRSMGVLVYHNSGLLRPSAPLKTLGERNGKSRSQVCRSRLWKEKYRGCSNQFGKLTRT
ncbi:hypothetical protein AR546_11150 [Leptospira interrogans serovar Canicola]|nr:hypothetical protein AR546_11150 [Leptospira interrogans serovar Canicola]